MTVSEVILGKDTFMANRVRVAGMLVGDAVARECRLVQPPERKRGGIRIVPCILICHARLFERLDTWEYWGDMRLVPGHPRYTLRALAEVVGTIAEAPEESFALAITGLTELILSFRDGPRSVPL